MWLAVLEIWKTAKSILFVPLQNERNKNLNFRHFHWSEGYTIHEKVIEQPSSWLKRGLKSQKLTSAIMLNIAV